MARGREGAGRAPRTHGKGSGPVRGGEAVGSCWQSGSERLLSVVLLLAGAVGGRAERLGRRFRPRKEGVPSHLSDASLQ